MKSSENPKFLICIGWLSNHFTTSLAYKEGNLLWQEKLNICKIPGGPKKVLIFDPYYNGIRVKY
jgi:hypothetical protein